MLYEYSQTELQSSRDQGTRTCRYLAKNDSTAYASLRIEMVLRPSLNLSNLRDLWALHDEQMFRFDETLTQVMMEPRF